MVKYGKEDGSCRAIYGTYGTQSEATSSAIGTEICPVLCGWTSDDDAWTGSATARDAVKPFGASKLVALKSGEVGVVHIMVHSGTLRSVCST